MGNTSSCCDGDRAESKRLAAGRTFGLNEGPKLATTLGNDRGAGGAGYFVGAQGGAIKDRLKAGSFQQAYGILAEQVGKMEQTFTQLAGEDLSMIKRRNAEQTAVTQHGDLEVILQHLAGAPGSEATAYWKSVMRQNMKAQVTKVCTQVNLTVDQNVKDERRARCMKNLQICLDIVAKY